MTCLLDELIDIYEPITRACCRSYRLSEDLMDDIVQDTFLAAYRNLPKYRGQTNKLRSWLWIIARSKIINLLRKQSKCGKIDISDVPRQSLPLPGNPAVIAQTKELRQKLRVSIADLPDTWMKVVMLYYWHHKNIYEIAMHMQIKHTMILVILRRSRRYLKRELEGLYAA